MSAIVPWKRARPRYQEIQVGNAVRGRLWHDAAKLLHWARAHGMHLVPAHNPQVTLAPTISRTFNYRVQPQGLAIARVWSVVLRGEGPTSGSRASVTYPDGVTVDYLPPEETGNGDARRIYFEDLSAKSAAVQTIALTIAHVAGPSDIFVESICCYELPRALLTQDATDRGVDLETIRPGQPIYEDPNSSAYGVILGAANTVPRRTLIEYAFADIQISAAGFTDLFPLSLPILPRKTSRSATTFTVTWEVEARATDGTTGGEIRITTDRSGNTSTIAVPVGATTFAFRGPGTVEADAENLAVFDGLPVLGTYEGVQIDARVTAGAGMLEIRSLAVWEAT